MNNKIVYRLALAGALLSHAVTVQATPTAELVEQTKAKNAAKHTSYQRHYQRHYQRNDQAYNRSFSNTQTKQQRTLARNTPLIKTNFSQKNGQVFATDAANNAIDINLQTCLHQSIAQQGAVYADELTNLSCYGQNISSLSGIEAFSGLTFLDFGSNQISDLSPLSGLQQLDTAFLWENQITDITPMAALPAIFELDVAFNPITDISPLTAHSSLVRLFVGGSGTLINDLTPLASISNLSWLGIFGQQLTNTDFTMGMNQLELIDLWQNPIADVTALGQLNLLTHIGLIDSLVADIAPILANANNNNITLEWLGLSGNQGVYCWQQDYAQQHMNIAFFDPSFNCDPSTDYNDYDADGMNNYDEVMFGSDPFGNGAQPPPPPPPTQRLISEALQNIPGWSFHLCVELAAQQGALIYANELTELNCGFSNIDSINGIEQFTELNTIHLPGNNLIDLTPLASLNQLIYLDVNSNQLVDISVLSNLPQLTELFLINNQISNIAVLSGLTNLNALAIAHNPITDFSPIGQLVNLQRLDSADNPLMDSNVLANLNNLTFIDITNTNISEINGLGQMSQLSSVYMTYNMVADISPILLLKDNWEALFLGDNTYCWQLNYIDAFVTVNNYQRPINCDISDDFNDFDGDGINNLDEVFILTNPLVADVPTGLTFDAALSMVHDPALHQCLSMSNTGFLYANELTTVHCPNHGISQLNGLGLFSGITLVNFDDNAITDISELASLTQLHTLFMHSNFVSDLTPLSGLTQLTDLQLIDNLIVDLVPLGSINSLTSLSIGRNQFTDILALNNLTNLVSLDLHETSITDLTPIANLTALNYLDINSTNIIDINPLADKAHLDYLMMMYTQVSDISPVLLFGNQWQMLMLSETTFCWQLDYLDHHVNTSYYQRPMICDLSDDYNDLDADGISNLDEAMVGGDPFVADIPPPPVTIEQGMNTLTDFNLANCIYNQHSHQLYDPIESLTHLMCAGHNINQLDGIGHFSGLIQLDIFDNHVTDLSPLSGITGLAVLFANDNPINNIDVVSDLPNLIDIGLSGATIADVSLLFTGSHQWQFMSLSERTYCWQVAYAEQYLSLNYFDPVLNCDATDDFGDWDNDQTTNMTEIQLNRSPIIYD